jgi:hypothetical protein
MHLDNIFSINYSCSTLKPAHGRSVCTQYLGYNAKQTLTVDCVSATNGCVRPGDPRHFEASDARKQHDIFRYYSCHGLEMLLVRDSTRPIVR